METKAEVRRAEGLTLEELEAQGHVELLPERLEMRRWKRHHHRRNRNGGLFGLLDYIFFGW